MAADPGITDIARQLAWSIPGDDTPEPERVEQWRETIYNAKAHASMRPLADLVERSAPEGDTRTRELAEILRRKR